MANDLFPLQHVFDVEFTAPPAAGTKLRFTGKEDGSERLQFSTSFCRKVERKDGMVYLYTQERVYVCHPALPTVHVWQATPTCYMLGSPARIAGELALGFRTEIETDPIEKVMRTGDGVILWTANAVYEVHMSRKGDA